MKTLKDYFGDSGLGAVILSLAGAVKEISGAVRTADGAEAGTVNASGEEQIALDVMADEIMRRFCIECENIGLIASEEMEGEEKVGEGRYAVAHDPLDGSSLVDVNLSVGTIVGVYEGDTFLERKGSEQVAALIAVYGPRTTIFVSVGDGTHEFSLVGGEFVLSKENVQVAEKAKMFAPGNLRACSKRKAYLDLVNYWCENQYKLRYSGGMVPDLNQIFLKGGGIFAYPGYEDQPNGKLRLLFECAPMAFLMEQAGGVAMDGQGRLLDKPLDDLHQRTEIFIGSKEEVERCRDFLS